MRAWKTLFERARRSIQELSAVPGDVRQMAARGEIETGCGTCAPTSISSARRATKSTFEPAESIRLPDVVSFRYRNLDGEEEPRLASAFRTFYRGGAAYLETRDLIKSDTRTFRLDRIKGPVTRMETGEIMGPWDWFRATSPTLPVRQTIAQQRGSEWQTAVFFAGFHEARRCRLEKVAEAAGWDVRGRISRTVDYVVAGPQAGRNQLAQADELGISVIDEDTFNLLV
jgi:hypothetical protein